MIITVASVTGQNSAYRRQIEGRFGNEAPFSFSPHRLQGGVSSSRPKGASAAAAHSIGKEVQAALVWLERRGTKRNRDGLARYAIRSEHVLDVSVADIRAYAKQLGPNHQLALALWKTGVYKRACSWSFKLAAATHRSA